MDALTHFPKNAGQAENRGRNLASLVKNGIFKGLMFYVYDSGNNRGKFYSLTLERVKHIIAMNSKGEIPTDLLDLQMLSVETQKTVDYDADDLTGVIELPPEERKNRRRNRNRNRNRRGGNNGRGNNNKNKKGRPDNKKKS